MIKNNNKIVLIKNYFLLFIEEGQLQIYLCIFYFKKNQGAEPTVTQKVLLSGFRDSDIKICIIITRDTNIS